MIKKTIIFLSIVIVFIHAGCTSFDKIQDNINQITNKNIENRLEAINGTYKLSPPDVIEIDVNDNPELRTRAIIRPDGNIFFPLLGDIYIEGLTPLEIREKIHKLLGRYLKELPEESVSVEVVGFKSKKVYIYSYGHGIREIPFTGDLTVLDAITQSGLLSRTADKRGIKVIRGESDTVKKPQKLVVNLNDIIKKGKTEKNIVLRPNDIVYIPPTLLGRIGFAAQDMLNPTKPVQNLGATAASAQYNALGFGGIPSTGR
jgi:polysaccharide export outer membrane protein